MYSLFVVNLIDCHKRTSIPKTIKLAFIGAESIKIKERLLSIWKQNTSLRCKSLPVELEKVAHVDADVAVCALEESEVSNYFFVKFQVLFTEKLANRLLRDFNPHHCVTSSRSPKSDVKSRVAAVEIMDIEKFYHFMSKDFPQSGKRILSEDLPLTMWLSCF